MAQVTITINSREYAIACDAGDEVRIIQLSRILDEKAKMLTAGGGHINENMLLAMIGLLLADEISELRKHPQGAEQTAPQEPKVVEKIIEKKPDLAPLDAEISAKLEKFEERLNLLAKQLEML